MGKYENIVRKTASEKEDHSHCFYFAYNVGDTGFEPVTSGM